MRIGVPELVSDGHEVKLQCRVDFARGEQHLWFSVCRDHAEFLTPERQDAFLVGLLPLAMETGEDIRLDGAISERLCYGLTQYYMPVVSIAVPHLRPVKIVPAELATDRIGCARGGVATGFSGGIDSFCVLADHFFGDVPPGFRLTHLVFNNVGSHGGGGRELFRRRYERLLPAAQAMDLPFLAIDSNLHELLASDFELTAPSRNAAAVLSLQKLVGRYLFASSNRYQDCAVRPPRPPPWPATGMIEADPVAMHLLSTETTECISTGCQYARTEKTRRVAHLACSHRYLDVCTDDGISGNCSSCYKCLRTMLTLEILGKLPQYDGVFDIEKYRRIRDRFLIEVLAGRSRLMAEIRELASKQEFRFPLSARVAAPFHQAVSWVRPHVPGSLRRVARLLLRR